MVDTQLNHPVRRQIIRLIATLGGGLVLMAGLYLVASVATGRIDHMMYEYHQRAEVLALRLQARLSAAQTPQGSNLSRDQAAVNNWRLFVAEAMRNYDEIVALEKEIKVLHRKFGDPAMPDRAIARLERATAELRSLRKRYDLDRTGFALALSESNPYLGSVANQLSRQHEADLTSLLEGRRRLVTAFEVLGGAMALCIFAGVWVLMRRNFRAIDALLEADVRNAEAMRESEAKFSAAFRGSPDVMVINRTRDGMIVDVNPAYERFFGYRRQELIGRTATELGVIADPLARPPFIERLLRDGKTVELPWRSRIRSGEVRDVLQSAYLIDIGGEQHHVAIIHDMTESKKAQAALRASEEELRKLNRELESRVTERTAQLQESNKELESFSYSVSHDLRAPLRHVAAYVGLLKQSLAQGRNEEAMQRMEVIANAARRMGNLIDDLLSFSSIGRQGMHLIALNTDAIVRGVLEDLQPETKGREIEWQIAALPNVIADHGLLQLVFMNLISNSVKFTRGRVPARIEVGCIGSGNDSAEHVVFVKDNGAGFDMRYSGKLFGVFQRLHSTGDFEGTGIGLANCRRIIERHSGRIWGEGIVDGGATFYFTIPKELPGS